MKRRAWLLGGAAILLCLLLGLGLSLWRQTAWGEKEVTFTIGTFDREVYPVVNSKGRILLVRSTGSKLKIFELQRWPKKVVLRTELEAGGFINRLSVATLPGGSPPHTLVTIRTCPGRAGVSEPEGGQGCPTGALLKSFAYELDRKGGVARGPVELPESLEWRPEPLEHDFLLLGHTLRPTFERAIYRDGRIMTLNVVEPVILGGYPSCTTEKELWILRGYRDPTGLPGQEKDSLWRLLLSQNGKAEFSQVEVPALNEITGLACGDDEAFVFLAGPIEEGGRLYSTKEPNTQIWPPVGTIWQIADHRGGLPTVRISNTKGSPCGVLLENGRVARKSVPRTKQSSCDAGVWRIGDRLVAVTQRAQGADYPPVSRVTVGPW